MAVYSRSFHLIAESGRTKNYRREMVASLVVPEPRNFEEIVAAWSYALRYSADGLDVPNYRKALELLRQRHPSWIVVDSQPIAISYDADYAEMDVPET
jgi:hypothetical protein